MVDLLGKYVHMIHRDCHMCGAFNGESGPKDSIEEIERLFEKDERGVIVKVVKIVGKGMD